MRLTHHRIKINLAKLATTATIATTLLMPSIGLAASTEINYSSEAKTDSILISQDWRRDNWDDRNGQNNQGDRWNDNRNWDRYTNEIERIYRQMLGRSSSREEERRWARQLARGRSLRDVRQEIAYSREAQEAINRIYQQVLGRNADRGGLRTWTRALVNGSSLRQIRREIERSDEARNLRRRATTP